MDISLNIRIVISRIKVHILHVKSPLVFGTCIQPTRRVIFMLAVTRAIIVKPLKS